MGEGIKHVNLTCVLDGGNSNRNNAAFVGSDRYTRHQPLPIACHWTLAVLLLGYNWNIDMLLQNYGGPMRVYWRFQGCCNGWQIATGNMIRCDKWHRHDQKGSVLMQGILRIIVLGLSEYIMTLIWARNPAWNWQGVLGTKSPQSCSIQAD